MNPRWIIEVSVLEPMCACVFFCLYLQLQACARAPVHVLVLVNACILTCVPGRGTVNDRVSD